MSGIKGEDKLERRMNLIGQNGNDGLHYEEEHRVINKYPSKVIVETDKAILSERTDTDAVFYEVHTKRYKNKGKENESMQLDFYKTSNNPNVAREHYNNVK